MLVTRARNQASALAELLAAAGATPILIPTIEIAPPRSFRALDEAIRKLQQYDWLLFTSANAVQVFAERAEALGQRPQPRRIGVIGPATAHAVQEKLGLPVARMPARYVAEEFVASLEEEARGASMLLVRAAVARDLIPTGLAAAGASVTIVDAYQNVVPAESIPLIQHLFHANPPDAITFTSASTAEHLRDLLNAAALEIPSGTVLASIGPITSAAMRDLGWEPTVEARQATIPSLVTALLETTKSTIGAMQ